MRTMFFVVLLALFSSSAQAQHPVEGFIESWNAMTAEKVVPQVNALIEKKANQQWGWQAWTLQSGEWGEALFGPTYEPAPWVTLSASIGLQAGDHRQRYGGGLNLKSERFSLLILREEGGDHWYRYLARWQVGREWQVGYNQIRGFGRGPYLEKSLAETSFGEVVVWGAYSVDQKKAILTGRLKF